MTPLGVAVMPEVNKTSQMSSPCWPAPRRAVSVDGRPLPGAQLGTPHGDHVEQTVGGIARQFSVHQVGDVVYVDSPLGSAPLTEAERFPEPGALIAAGSLLAPVPGTVVRVAVAVGDTVAAGALVVVAAPAAGVVAELTVQAGQAVDAGAELARVEPAESHQPPESHAQPASPEATTMIVKPFVGPDTQEASRSRDGRTRAGAIRAGGGPGAGKPRCRPAVRWPAACRWPAPPPSPAGP
jgi:biotin carboxyl carrier protein